MDDATHLIQEHIMPQLRQMEGFEGFVALGDRKSGKVLGGAAGRGDGHGGRGYAAGKRGHRHGGRGNGHGGRDHGQPPGGRVKKG